jgi:hypothetical protein
MNGAIPDGMCILHRCDNPPCVNPNHLFLGTKRENFEDMINKRRESREFRARQQEAKLTPESVREARRLYYAGRFTQAQLARRYGVSDATMSHAITGRTWKHVA